MKTILDYTICFILKYIPVPKKLGRKLVYILVYKIRK